MVFEKKNIFAGIRIILRPVVRMCLRNGISAPECVELLKATFLDIALETLDDEGHSVNSSRLAAATGLQRKDIVKRSENPTLPEDSLSSKILGLWQANPEFLNSKGKPKHLTYEGNESEFANLVRAVSSDLNSYTLLFEFERTGRVKKVGKLLHLVAPVFMLDSPEDFTRACQIVEEDWDDMFSAVSENLGIKREIPNLHLRTEYDNVSVESLHKIREWILDRGTSFHEDLRAYLSKFDKDSNPRLHKKTGGCRVAVSAFSFVEEPKKLGNSSSNDDDQGGNDL